MAIKKKAAKKTVAKKAVKKTVEAAAPEVEASAISTEALTALAEELNEVIKPNPPIAVNNTDTLKAEIEETAPMLVAGDKISKASAETIEALGLKDSLKDIIVKEDKEVKDKAKAEKGKKIAAAKTAPAKKEKKPAGEKKSGGAIAFAAQLIKEKKTEKEIEKAFVKYYADKGKTDLEFVKKRVAIYIKLAA